MNKTSELRARALKALQRRRWLFNSEVYNELHYLVTKGIKQAEGSAWYVKQNPATKKKAYHCENCDYRVGVPAKRCIGCGFVMTDESGVIRVHRNGRRKGDL